MDFDYKKYSLEHLENWIHDVISCSEASPQEIYDVIKGVVQENYHIYKDHTERCYELLALLNGNGRGHIKAYDEYLETKKVCDRDDSSPECQKSWNDFWEENYYPEEVENKDKNINYSQAVSEGYTMTADGFWIPREKDKVVKWQLPVEADPSGEYFVTFPDDLLEAANLKEGDKVEWVDQGDGSYLLKKYD